MFGSSLQFCPRLRTALLLLFLPVPLLLLTFVLFVLLMFLLWATAPQVFLFVSLWSGFLCSGRFTASTHSFSSTDGHTEAEREILLFSCTCSSNCPTQLRQCLSKCPTSGNLGVNVEIHSGEDNELSQFICWVKPRTGACSRLGTVLGFTKPSYPDKSKDLIFKTATRN